MKIFGFTLFELAKPQMPAIPQKQWQHNPAQDFSRMLAFNERQQRAYDAAITTNLNQDFPMTVGSPNAEVLSSQYIMRGRNRKLKKDYPITKGVDRVFRNNICGDDPFRLEMKVGKQTGKTFDLETETNQKIQDAWADAMRPENCTVRRDMNRMEMYHCIISSAMGSGGIVVRKHETFPNNEFKFAVELIAPDRLQESYMGRAPETGNEIRFSIERDKWNAPVAYWILSRHPGDTFAYNGFTPNIIRERVPAEEIIFFNNLRTEPEQDIGVSEFDSTIQTLHRDRQFDIAHVTAAIWSAAKPATITQEFPTGISYVGDPNSTISYTPAGEGGVTTGGYGQNQGLAPGDGNGGGANKYKTVSPSQVEILPYGQKLTQLDPKFPIEAAVGFKRNNMLDVASGVGLSYGSVSSDFEKYSFSTARAAQVPERDNFKVYQKHMILSFVTQHFEAWLKSAIMAGVLDLPLSRYKEFCKSAVFHPKRWPYINPLQDVQADVIKLEVGLESRQGILANSEEGKTVEDIDSEQAVAKEIDEAHGLDFSNDANTPTLKKGDPGQVHEPVTGAQEQAATPPGKKSRKQERIDLLMKRATETLALNGDHS